MTIEFVDYRPLLKQLRICCLVAGAWCLPVSGHAQNQALEQAVANARSLLEQQRVQEAFLSLIQLELDGAGDIGFDYWLGVIAVRAGEIDQAITALERVIMVQPTHAGARLELAGIFILQNRTVEASAQLDIAEQMNPPDAARLTIDRYRQSIVQLEQGGQEFNKLSMISVDLGHDSNYLSYPDSFDLFANSPLQGIAVLGSDSTNYTQLRGLHFRELTGWGPFEKNEWLSTVQTRRNQTSGARAFDTTAAQTMLTSVGTFFGGLELRTNAGLNQLWLDGKNYRTGVSAGLQMRQVFNERSELSANIRIGKNRFSDTRNDNTSLSGELVYINNLSANTRLRLAAFLESEDTSGQLTRQGGDSFRQRLDIQITVGQPQAINRFVVGINYHDLMYRKPGFAVLNQGVADKRSDHSAAGHVEWMFQPTSSWRISSRLQLREQSSNMAFFAMDQTVAQFSVNYLF